MADRRTQKQDADPAGRLDALRATGDFAEALVVAHELLRARRAHPGAGPFEVGDAERWVSTLEHVLTLSEEDRAACARADALTEAIESAVVGVRYRDALAAAEEQLACRERLFGRRHAETARSLEAVANARLELAELEEAERTIEELIEIRREVLEPGHPDLAMAIKHKGGACWMRADLAAAERHVREAVGMWSRAHDTHPGLAIGLFSLARVTHETGRFAEAEPLYRAALTIQRRLDPDDPSVVPLCLVHLARLVITQGDDDSGETMLREAMETCDRLGAPALTAGLMALHTTVGALAWRGDHEKADALREESLRRVRAAYGDDDVRVANRYHEWGQSLLKRRRFAEAEQMISRALEIRRAAFGPDHPASDASLLELARARAGQGDRVGAMEHVRAAFSVGEGMGVRSRPLAVDSLTMIGNLERLAGRLADSEATLRDATRGFELARARLRHGAGRAAFVASPYPSLALTQLALGRNDEAWRTIERGLGRVLSDLVVDADGLSESDRGLEAARLRELADAEGQLRTLKKETSGDAEVQTRIEACRRRLDEAELAWSTLHEQIMREQPVSEGAAFDLQRVRAALGGRDAIIGWLDVAPPGLEPETWGYVLKRDGATRWHRLYDACAAASRERIASYREHMRARGRSVFATPPGDELEAIEEEIFTAWLAPLLGEVGDVESLVVIAAGELVGVPIEGLIARRSELEGVTVSYSPSATLYTWLAETRAAARRRSPERRRALVVGDPPFRPEHVDADDDDRREEMADGSIVRGGRGFRIDALPRLPGSRAEVERVSGHFTDAVALLGREASEEALRSRASDGSLRDFDVLHIATHALVNAASPELSMLVLSQVDLPDARAAAIAGSPVARGIVTARDVTHTWNLDAELVTLSACDTGTGRRIAGEGLVGFVHAFMRVGARALLVSLWPVDDRATQLLMDRFYASWLREGQSKSRALRDAKRSLREMEDPDGSRPFVHPFYWAAFVLFGDPS